MTGQLFPDVRVSFQIAFQSSIESATRPIRVFAACVLIHLKNEPRGTLAELVAPC